MEPNGPGTIAAVCSFAGSTQGPHGLSWEAQSLQNQVQQLTTLLAQSNANVAAAMMGENFGAVSAATGYGMQIVPSAFFGTQARPFYCFVHGSNTSHNGAQCKVMTQNPLYTVEMKAVTSSATGGNPNVGPPVSRPMLNAFAPPVVCSPCALSSLTQTNAIKRHTLNDENLSAGLATHADARTIRGHNRLSRARVDELSLPACVSTVPVSMHVLPVVSLLLPVVSFPLPKVRAPKQARAPMRGAKSLTWFTPLITSNFIRGIPRLTPALSGNILP
jgi:hypothetical protein